MQYLTKDYSVDPTKFLSSGLSVVTPWQNYTPVFSSHFGTPTEVDFKYSRNGSTVKILGRLKTGTVAGGIHTFSLPNGWRANCNQGAGSGAIIGRAVRGILAESNVFTLIANDSNFVSIGANVSMSSSTHNPTTINSTTWFGSGEIVHFECELPISELYNSNQIVLGNEPVITNWVSYNPIYPGWVFSSGSCFWRRIGDSINIMGGGKVASVSANPPTIPLPTGLLLDTSKLISRVSSFGTFQDMRIGSSHASFNPNSGIVGYHDGIGASAVRVFIQQSASLYTLDNANIWIGANDSINWHFTAPIQGWDQFNGYYSLETIVPQNLAKAFGRVSASGVLLNSFNIASVTKTGTGTYQVTLSNPFPNADSYMVIGSSGLYFTCSQISGSQFNVSIYNGSTANTDHVFNFQVFGN
jgi:hypothetical protein